MVGQHFDTVCWAGSSGASCIKIKLVPQQLCSCVCVTSAYAEASQVVWELDLRIALGCCRLTTGMGLWWPDPYKAKVTWGAAMCQFWHSRSSMHCLQCTGHSSLESRSYGSKNTVQCLRSAVDEAQQAHKMIGLFALPVDAHVTWDGM